MTLACGVRVGSIVDAAGAAVIVGDVGVICCPLHAINSAMTENTTNKKSKIMTIRFIFSPVKYDK